MKMGVEPEQYDGLLHLLKASSKKLVNDICNQTVASLYNTAMRDETPAKLQDQLSISAHDAKQLSAALEKLLHEAIYHGYDDSSKLQSIFPSDFHSNLRDLLSRVIVENMGSWRRSMVEYQVSLPKLKEFSWKLNESRSLPPTCIVTVNTSSDQAVKVEMSRETLNTMLDSLSKIRDQISSIAQ